LNRLRPRLGCSGIEEEDDDDDEEKEGIYNNNVYALIIAGEKRESLLVETC
jgi:hypothetical protein